MADSIASERNELQKDEEKLQTALNKFGNWPVYDEDYSDDDDDDVDEDQLLIDIDADNETSELSQQTGTGPSTAPSCAGSQQGSISHSVGDAAGDEDSSSRDAVSRLNLELPSHIAVDYRADPQKTLHLNRTLQSILEQHIEDIKQALKDNKERQTRLEEDAHDLIVKAEKKGAYAGSFRAPYFRHLNGYPPANEDVTVKKQSGDYDASGMDSYRDLRHFNKTAKLLLREAVYQDLLEQSLKPIISKMELEISKRDAYLDECEVMSYKLEMETKQLEDLLKEEDENSKSTQKTVRELKKNMQDLKKSLEEKNATVEVHKQEINKLEQIIKEKKNVPEAQILANIDTEKVDWMKIAKQHFNDLGTWLDCQKAWENMVSPTVNKKPWTRDEDKRLVEVVRNSSGDWKAVAGALGHGRTPFQCFSRYQRRFNTDLKSRPWTEEEDAKLVRVTNNVKDSVGFFSWSKVSTLMDSRSPIECMYRFTKIDPSQSRGRWTELEDAKLLAAVGMIGPSWSKVSKFIGTRNMVQCRDRYLNCLAPNINFSHFTYDEDIKLLKLHKQLGPAWSKMVAAFVGRTDSMLLNRFRQLQRWRVQDEWFSKQSEETKKMLLGKSLTVAERQQMKAKAIDYMSSQLGVAVEDYKRRELDRQNGLDPDIIPPRPPRHLRCYSSGGSLRSLEKWTTKLDIHKRLAENLHKLMIKEVGLNMEKSEKNRKVPSRLAAEISEDIMNQTVEEVMKERRIPQPIGKRMQNRFMGQFKRLDAALNKAFLTTANVSVQDLLQASQLEKKKGKNREKKEYVDSQLKNILRKRGKARRSRIGRNRRFFDKDTRPVSVIEAELDELDKCVPLMLLKYLGTDLQSLSSAIHHQCLNYQEQLSKHPTYEQDEDFKQEEAVTQDAIQKLLASSDVPDSIKQQQLRGLKKKLKFLRKIYKEKKYLLYKMVETKIVAYQDDLEYLEELKEKNVDLELKQCLNLMVCNPEGGADAAFDSEMSEAGGPPAKKPTSSSSDADISATPTSQSEADSLVLGSLTQAGQSSDSPEFAVPTVPTRPKRKKRQYPRCEPPEKKFRALSEEEISKERRKIPIIKKRIISSLPSLPPALSTILGLRNLFLNKRALLMKAGSLLRFDRQLASEADLASSLLTEGSADFPGLSSSLYTNWSVTTSSEELMEQAKCFEGYPSSSQEPEQQSRSDPFQASIDLFTFGQGLAKINQQESYFQENGALIFPLEEKGGHLPESNDKRIVREPVTELKPQVIEECRPHFQINVGNTEPNSRYEVVVGYSGNFTDACSSNKDTAKQNGNMTSTATSSENLLPQSFSLVPIKTDIWEDLHPAAPDRGESGALTASLNLGGPQSSNVTVSQSSCDPKIHFSQAATSAPSQPIARSVHSNSRKDQEDDDVVAVIHIDDDDDNIEVGCSTPRTVFNLCAGPAPNPQGRQRKDNRDNEIVIVSGGEETYQVLPQESINNQLDDLSLPESCIQSIMSNSRLQNYKSRIVLVGVDESSKRIVHFKAEDDKFTAFEALPTVGAEDYSFRRRGCRPSVEHKPVISSEAVRSIRQTDEYKLFAARFHALFSWPALLSTVKPSPLNDGTQPAQDPLAQLQSDENQRKARKRLRAKQSIARKEHMRVIRAYSLAARRKKRMERLSKQAADKKEEVANATIAVKGKRGRKRKVKVEDNATTDQPSSEAGQGGLEAVVKQETVPRENIAAGQDKKAKSTAGDGKVKKPGNRKGRPKGSKNKKYEVVRKDRPRRSVRNLQEDRQSSPPSKESSRILPQWWKDAVLAAMLAKKAMSDEKEMDVEVKISEDDDFIDKGNYSDDEWYQELIQEETKVAKSNEEATQAELTKREEELANSYSAETSHILVDSVEAYQLPAGVVEAYQLPAGGVEAFLETESGCEMVRVIIEDA